MIVSLQMEGTELQSEQATGSEADPGAQQGASGYIDRVVDSDIDLRISNEKSPCEYQPPPAAELS